MSFQRTLVGAGVGLVAVGAVAGAVWISSSAGEPPEPVPVVVRSGDPKSSTAERDVSSEAVSPVPDRPVETTPLGPTKLLAMLESLDGIWAAPKGLQGDEYYRAIGRRDAMVEDLVKEAAALGPETVAEARIRMHGEGSSYPRQIFLMRTLSALGTEEALRLLADIAISRNAWRVRDFAFRQLVGSPSEAAVTVVREFLPGLDDPRFVVPVLHSDWEVGDVEGAYRGWLEKAESMSRNKSYSFLVRVEGDWPDDLLREVAPSAKPAPERAGAIGALSVRKPEGCLAYFRDLLWVEEDPTVIKALIRAIVRVGDEEGRTILAEYAAVGAPDELREYTERAVRAPKPIRTDPGDPGGPVMHGVQRKDSDPNKGRLPR